MKTALAEKRTAEAATASMPSRMPAWENAGDMGKPFLAPDPKKKARSVERAFVNPVWFTESVAPAPSLVLHPNGDGMPDGGGMHRRLGGGALLSQAEGTRGGYGEHLPSICKKRALSRPAGGEEENIQVAPGDVQEAGVRAEAPPKRRLYGMFRRQGTEGKGPRGQGQSEVSGGLRGGE